MAINISYMHLNFINVSRSNINSFNMYELSIFLSSARFIPLKTYRVSLQLPIVPRFLLLLLISRSFQGCMHLLVWLLDVGLLWLLLWICCYHYYRIWKAVLVFSGLWQKWMFVTVFVCCDCCECSGVSMPWGSCGRLREVTKRNG